MNHAINNDLLSDLEDSHHEFLLTSGNLKPKRNTEWSDKKPWKHTGYIAKIGGYVCLNCKANAQNLIGIFDCQTRGLDTKQIALDLSQISPGDISYTKEYVQMKSLFACQHCV